MGSFNPIQAAVGGAGTLVNYLGNQQADKNANNAEIYNVQQQQALQNQALGGVNALTRQIANDTPTQLAGKSTGQFVSNLRSNMAGAGQPNSQSALAPVAGANPRYAQDVANAQTQVQNYGNTAAGNMGAINGQTLERQNEGLAQQTMGTTLNGINAQSQMDNYVNQLRAQSAAQGNPWTRLLGNALTLGAQAWNPAPKTQAAPVLGNGQVAGGVNATQLPAVGNWWDNSQPMFSLTGSRD